MVETHSIRTAVIIVAGNHTLGPIKVISAVRYGGVVPFSEVSSTASSSDILIPRTSHMINNRIHVNPVKQHKLNHKNNSWGYLRLKLLIKKITESLGDIKKRYSYPLNLNNITSWLTVLWFNLFCGLHVVDSLCEDKCSIYFVTVNLIPGNDRIFGEQSSNNTAYNINQCWTIQFTRQPKKLYYFIR